MSVIEKPLSVQRILRSDGEHCYSMHCPGGYCDFWDNPSRCCDLYDASVSVVDGEPCRLARCVHDHGWPEDGVVKP